MKRLFKAKFFAGPISVVFAILPRKPILCSAMVLYLAAVSYPAWSQEVDRAKIDSAFNKDLEVIAAKCDEIGKLAQQAEITREWASANQRLPDRLYFFIPPENDQLEPNEEADANVKFWYRRFRNLRNDYSDQLFEIVKQLAENQQDRDAFVLLHEVLYQNPDHESARKALGYKKDSMGRWYRDRARIRATKANHAQKQFRWRAGSYWKIRSPHFSIDCAGDQEAGKRLAENAERWYLVWRQLFFDYWNRGQTVKNWIDGKSADTGSKHQFEIVLFRDRAQYLHDLSTVPGIEISAGYYNDAEQLSFFYLDNNIESTWRHELTHQWFQETIPTVDSPSEESHAWALEGIAMFMESMQEQGSLVTIGGIDALRLQYARLRFNREGFFKPIQAVSEMGREQLQQDPDVRKIYSQSAGLSHMLMLEPEQRDHFVQFLKKLYTKGADKAPLDEYVGDLAELDRQYRDWLVPVNLQTFDAVNSECRALSLPKSGINAAQMEVIGQLEQLEWLELSQNPIDDQGLLSLKNSSQLQELFLDSTGVTDKGLQSIVHSKHLTQLDLSATKVSDSGMDDLAKILSLQALWLAKTDVSDTGIQKLAALSNLQFIDLRATKVTDAGVRTLQQALPDLQIIK